MSINGISTGYLAGYRYNTKTTNTRGSSFTERMGENVVTGTNKQTLGNQSYNKTVNQTKPMDAYLATAVQGCNEIPSLEDILPMETERYLIRNASDMEGVPAYAIYDKEFGKYAYIREDQLAIQKDAASGFAFVIDMSQPFSSNVRVTDELRGLLNDLAEKRNIELPEVPLQGGLAVNRDPKTGLNYLTMQGNEAKGISVIITSQEDIDTLESLADEFMQYSAIVREREIAGLWALLEISGNLKRESDGFTYLSPDGISYVPYNGDNSAGWYIPYPSLFDYSKAREFLAKGSNLSDAYTWLGVFPKAEVLWPDVEPWNQYNKIETGHGFQYTRR